MAILKKVPHRVGIKELKDRASSIIDQVERKRQSVTITRNNREVARIVPAETDDLQRLMDLGLVARPALHKWKDLVLEPVGVDAREAIEAIIRDRDER